MMHPVETVLGYVFRDRAWLEEALTHPSCNLTRNGQPFHYQRLEFLGDSVLGLIISDMLLHAFPQEPEGLLARRKAALVEGKALAKQMQVWGIEPHIVMSAGEEAGGGRSSKSILEDVCEALIGAIYRDGGFEAARKVVENHWRDLLQSHAEAPKDAKTALQEWAQGRGLPLPEYQLVSSEGPAHEPLFKVKVAVRGYGEQIAEAGNKRRAEQIAAARMLEVVENG